MADIPRNANDLEVAGRGPVRHRIVQSRGRRYSIKLEEAYWTFLEETARREGVRLNRLIGRLAAEHPPGNGFAAALRVFCLETARGRLAAAEEAAQRASMASGRTDLVAIVNACPAPALLLGQDRRILLVNEPFNKWMGTDSYALVGKPADHFFQIRGHFRLDELWARFGQGMTAAVPAKLAYVAPGRVTVAKAQLCAAAIKGPDDFCCLVMLEHGTAH